MLQWYLLQVSCLEFGGEKKFEATISCSMWTQQGNRPICSLTSIERNLLFCLDKITILVFSQRGCSTVMFGELIVPLDSALMPGPFHSRAITCSGMAGETRRFGQLNHLKTPSVWSPSRYPCARGCFRWPLPAVVQLLRH